MEKKDIIIDFKEGGKEFKFLDSDFKRITYFCLNECMGIQFIISAEALKKMTENLKLLGFKPPFTNADFLSPASRKEFDKKENRKLMEKNFGTGDIEIILPLIVKQTYNFLHKI